MYFLFVLNTFPYSATRDKIEPQQRYSHPDEYHGVSIQSCINKFGKIISSFISQILDLIYWNKLYFWWCDSENQG